MFCLTPISKIFKNCMEEQYEAVTKMLGAVGVTLTKEDLELRQKPLLKRCMQKWLPAHDALLEMLVQHLPSPKKAQTYRAATLYTGPSDDIYCQGIKNCDSDGPLMMYISKLIPTPDKGRFYAFGRVFSGTVRTGQKVKIMGPNYVQGKKEVRAAGFDAALPGGLRFVSPELRAIRRPPRPIPTVHRTSSSRTCSAPSS